MENYVSTFALFPNLGSRSSGGDFSYLKGTRPRWPVWKGSARAEVKFQPLSGRRAARLFSEAKRFEGQTRRPGRQDGKIGRNGILVLQTLLFDFLNHKSGRLDPSYEAIAKKANISRSSVAKGLAALKAAGIIHWVRRCIERFVDGRYSLEQETNAYAVLPSGQWRGYRPTPVPLTPESGTWGDHPPLDAFDDASSALRSGDGLGASVTCLEADPTNALALSLARLGRSLLRSKS